MNPSAQNRPRRGGIFPFLALILTISMIFGFFSALHPEKKLARAIENTRAAISREEETLGFLYEAFQEGKILAENGTDTLLLQTNLPESALLTLSGTGYDAALTLQEENWILESKSLLNDALFASRLGAASALEGSLFSLPELEKSVLPFLRLFLSVTDPAFSDENDALSDALSALWKKARPTRETERVKVKESEKEISAEKISYRVDGEKLSDLLSFFPAVMDSEEICSLLEARLSAVYAVMGKSFSREDKESLSEFLSGNGASFNRFSEALKKEGASFTFAFVIAKAEIRNFELFFVSDAQSFCIEADFAKDENGKWEQSFALMKRSGEETLFSASLTQKIVESSKKAYIREMEFDVSDPELRFFDQAALSGKVRYSWGKEKGDVGLRIILPAHEVNFRGQLDEYKKGKTLRLSISRIEVDRANVLTSGAVKITVTKEKTEIPRVSLPEKKLFGEGEEQTLLQEAFLAKYREIFP